MTQSMEVCLDFRAFGHACVPGRHGSRRIGCSVVGLAVALCVQAGENEQLIREFISQRFDARFDSFLMTAEQDDCIECNATTLMSFSVLFFAAHPVATDLDRFGVQVDTREPKSA